MKHSIGFIGGGQMASALASGAIQAGVFQAGDLTFAEPDTARHKVLRAQYPGCTLVDDNAVVFERCTQVILAVKPHVLKKIAPELKPHVGKQHLVVSIAAGISLEQLRMMLDTRRLIRVMPNTPCQVGAGASAISAEDDVADSDIQWVEQLFGSVGITVRVPDHLIHAVTGVSGSSPAYVYLVIEALSDGGVAMGLPRATATRLAAQAVMGAAKMVLETGLHPGQLKDQVTSPAGTTIDALRELESAGIRSAFIEAVCRCTEKSRRLE